MGRRVLRSTAPREQPETRVFHTVEQPSAEPKSRGRGTSGEREVYSEAPPRFERESPASGAANILSIVWKNHEKFFHCVEK